MSGPFKNVYIIGAQCVGKTTLVQGLKEYCQNNALGLVPTLIDETARTVLKEHNFSRDDIQFSPDRCMALQQAILKAQYEREHALDPETWYIFDRSGLDPLAYASLYVGPQQSIELRESKEWLFLHGRMKQGIVFLLDGDPGWLNDDGVRLIAPEEERLKLHESFRHLLEEEKIPYHVIGRDQVDLVHRINIVCQSLGIPQP